MGRTLQKVEFSSKVEVSKTRRSSICGGGGDSTMAQNIHDTAGSQKKMEIVVGPGEGIRAFPTRKRGESC